MVQALWDQLPSLLGLGKDVANVDAGEMALRTVAIYALTLAVVRLGGKRFLGKGAPMDVVVGIMLGSVMSRAINGSAPFFPTLAAGAVLIGLDWLLAALAFRFRWLGPLVKGTPILLIEDGHLQRRGLWRGILTTHDLEEALRLQAKLTDPSKVQLAYLERNGSISMIPSRHEPRILTVSVEDGVQTVRIELE